MRMNGQLAEKAKQIAHYAVTMRASTWRLAGWGVLAILTATVAAFGHRTRRRSTEFDGASDAFAGAQTIEVGAEVAGEVAEVYVREGHIVQAGDALIDLGVRPYEFTLERALVRLAERRAELQKAQRNHTRMQRLVRRGFISRQGAEIALAQARTAAAALCEAEVAVRRAALDVQRTHITAPADGIVTNVTPRPGAAVQPRTPLVVLARNH